MAIHKGLIIVICTCEVIAHIHSYAVKPSYYRREPRPPEVYVVDPRKLPPGYARPYPVPVPEAIPANYPLYQKVIDPVPPNYQVYQEIPEPRAPNLQLYQQPTDTRPPNYQVYQQPTDPRPPNYQVYQQPVDPRPPPNYQVYQSAESRPIYQEIVEPIPYFEPIPKPAEPVPIHHPVYQPVDVKPEVQAIASAAELLAPILKNDKPNDRHDSTVLNNLAIALQLLIINNLLNYPAPDVSSFDTIKNAIEDTRASINYRPCEFDFPAPMANAKFLGASNFDDANSLIGLGYGSPPTSPRVGSLLKSPYDYLSSTSQATEFSSAPPTKSKLQSPYAAILSADSIKDLFTLPDYY